MKLTKFYGIRAFEGSVYSKKLTYLMSGMPIDSMPRYLTAEFVFDSLKEASPEVSVNGGFIKEKTQVSEMEQGSSDNVAIVIVQKSHALIGRYIVTNNNGNSSSEVCAYLQISGRFKEPGRYSIWPDKVVQLRTVTKTESGTIQLGPVHFHEPETSFFTEVLAPCDAQLAAHSRIASLIS